MALYATAVVVLLCFYLRRRMLLDARLEFARNALAVSLETQTALLHAVTSLRQELTGVGVRTGSRDAGGRALHELAIMDRELKRALSQVDQAKKAATPESVAKSLEQKRKSFSLLGYFGRLASGTEELDQELGVVSKQVDELRRLHNEVLLPLFSVERPREAMELHLDSDARQGGVHGTGP